jgi:hypothetical protein
VSGFTFFYMLYIWESSDCGGEKILTGLHIFTPTKKTQEGGSWNAVCKCGFAPH